MLTEDFKNVLATANQMILYVLKGILSSIFLENFAFYIFFILKAPSLRGLDFAKQKTEGVTPFVISLRECHLSRLPPRSVLLLCRGVHWTPAPSGRKALIGN